MRTIAEQITLKGECETITISEFRARPGEVLKQIELGKEYKITRKGKVVAEIKPPENFDWQALAQLRK